MTANTTRRPSRPILLLSAGALALGLVGLSTPSWGAARDSDGDGMPNRWEVRHGLDPRTPNARGDKDHDGLRNLAEFRLHGLPEVEDTDHDGQDDGDEVHDGRSGTRLTDSDSDDDGVLDGDEDSDHDGTDNEDEDDATETCSADDDDSDDDGVSDGDEDSDHDGQADEDDDDSADDSCSDDSEDTDDLLGPIVSFDAGTGALVVATMTSGELTFTVTDQTRIEFDSSGHGSGGDATTDDLTAGTNVTEVDLADDGTLEDVELERP